MIEYTDLKVQQAKELAYFLHKDQTYGSEPYTNHLEDVTNQICLRYSRYTINHSPSNTKNELLILGYLHDVLEDTECPEFVIEHCFGGRILYYLQIISDPKVKPRKERKKQANAKLTGCSTMDYAAIITKAIDRYCNIRACVETHNNKLLAMYKREQKDFYTAAYRPELCDDVWYDINTLLNRGL